MSSLNQWRCYCQLPSKSFVPAVVLAAAVVRAHPLALAGSSDTEQHWVGTWVPAVMARPSTQISPGQPQPTPVSDAQTLPLNSNAQHSGLAQSPLEFSNQTLREIVHVSIGGEQVRVVFSNTFGTAPLTIGAAHVALRHNNASILPHSDRALTFGGSGSATIPPGAILASDAGLTVPPLSDLAIDLYCRVIDFDAAIRDPAHPSSICRSTTRAITCTRVRVTGRCPAIDLVLFKPTESPAGTSAVSERASKFRCGR
jgi:hypothetical protein